MFKTKQVPPVSHANNVVAAEPAKPVKPLSRASTVPSIISAEMTIHGDLHSNGDLQIEGTIIGDLNVTKLTIAEGGSVSGNIVAKNVRICGALNGSVRSEMVTLTATARVVGDIHHELLAIETGGQLEGMSRRLVANAPQISLPPHGEETERGDSLAHDGHEYQHAAG
jgi:cytoskeletal protein CcmA (bactofilin family)